MLKGFEWDENKRKINLEKHGIDFVDAIRVFNDSNRIEAETLKKEETRYQTMGVINGAIILLVYTNRSEKKRIISARRASKNERALYYKSE